MKGYPVPAGYMGYDPRLRRWILYATEQEYLEELREESS